ncbi:parallel beta-helix repeat protein [Roseimicrobium gellanilyticum]|uniref:Parallel beta-helix repeat protein n=1 Tax=Roseimicrobium gellanilyticum TaxID=748857 RepID=A0A366HIN9_9BACT|nr:right-handed parallel beta-helix repeat-containing protein [Roseimicrobium gellanilyticum]RBP42628.1 parallel beta-helix repeat protein [Roseimicrobium gellanilyticum]
MPDPKKPLNLDDIDFGATLRGHQKGDRVFDRFLLEKLLGRGGMGVVWLGTDERLGREVALKFAPEAVRYDDVAVDELKEETKKGLNLAHPNIVKIYDFLVDETHAAISMEFIDGENLGALRTRQPNKVFETRQIALWVGQFLDALDYAHRIAKVIHRDLKPANLMIDREGNLRVTDFGIARSISDAMNRATLGIGNSTGTLAYMSPQQADGKKPHITDDLYAFGSTLYELLTGKPPFFSGNIISQLQHDPVTSLTERREEFGITAGEPIPIEWEQTILACLEKSPENRPASALAVRQRLGLAPACQPEVPPLPAVPGGSGAVGGAPTNFSHSAAHLPTAHGPTQTYVRPGAGLTEMSLPNRPIGSGAIKVGPGVTPVQPPTTHDTQQPATKKGSGGVLLVVGLLAVFFILAVVGGGGWWAWNNTPYLKKLLGKEVAVNPGNQDPTPTPTPEPPPTPPGPGPGPTPTPTPPGPGPAPTPTPPGPGPTPTPTPTPPTNQKIQALIDKAKAGDTVTIPEGIYEEQIKFKSSITLKAAVPGKVIIQTDGRSGSVFAAENCEGGTVSGFVFQHTGTEVTEKVNWPVVLVKVSSIVMDGCTIQAGLGNGLEVTGACKPQFIKCIIRNNTVNGVVFESGASGALTEADVRKNGENGADIRFTGTHPTFSKCTFAENGFAGIVAKDGGSVSVLDQSRCLNNNDAGIAVSGKDSFINVVGAELQGNVIGIAVMDGGAKAKVQECIITESQQAGIQVQAPGAGTELLNNTVQGSKMDGILASGASGEAITIIGNKVKGNGGNGILIFGSGFKPKVEQNEVSTNGQTGIYAGEGVSGTVKDNTVRGNHLGSIKNEGAAADIVIQGNLADESQ